jgi:uncharacterized repeat protein (TIGR03803 family)
MRQVVAARAVLALAAGLTLALPAAHGAERYQRLRSFGFPELAGNQPEAPLILGSDGALYGTTYGSGNNRAGAVFRFNQDGTGYGVLHSFTVSGGDGRIPLAGLVEGSDGALYGTTSGGGATNQGTVFKLNKDGSGYRILHSFGTTPGDGRRPQSGLVEGKNGVLYGTTYVGGAGNGGVVFKLDKDGGDYALLHSFTIDFIDGYYPAAGLVEGDDGALYGTTVYGGLNDAGAVFTLNNDGSAYNILHVFSGGTEDGQNPRTGLTEGSGGALFGTTQLGGKNNAGTVFTLNKDGSGFNVLHSFTGAGGDGSIPSGELLEGDGGVLYGTTYYGGSNGFGTVFRVSEDGSDFGVLHSFKDFVYDGYFPYAGLIKSADGALYGTTQEGGIARMGTVFKLNEDGSNYRVLRSFNFSGGDGYYLTALAVHTNGTLFGTTQDGGTYRDGSVYKLNQDGSGYSLLHSFSFSTGRGPGGVTVGSDGALYGTTGQGGSNDVGTVFKLNQDGSGHTMLHAFGADVGGGQHPNGPILEASDGALYGTARDGGVEGVGIVFTMTKNGSNYAVLHNFSRSDNDGQSPYAGLLEGDDGALYGTTFNGGTSGYGTVFKLNKDGGGYAVLHSFIAVSGDGLNPTGMLIRDDDGALYGTTFFGGTGGAGTVFKLNSDGNGYDVLHSFTGPAGTYSANPSARLLEWKDGALYGTARHGGSNNLGMLFKLAKDGSGYSVLHHFSTSGNDGYEPWGALVTGTDGALYGTTYYGGEVSLGLVFKLWPEQIPNVVGLTLAGGIAQVTFMGTSGNRYQILRSPNLVNWALLTTVTMPEDGTYIYQDNSLPDSTVFYRAAWLP